MNRMTITHKSSQIERHTTVLVYGIFRTNVTIHCRDEQIEGETFDTR
jgi:hypothetical protein